MPAALSSGPVRPLDPAPSRRRHRPRPTGYPGRISPGHGSEATIGAIPHTAGATLSAAANNPPSHHLTPAHLRSLGHSRRLGPNCAPPMGFRPLTPDAGAHTFLPQSVRRTEVPPESARDSPRSAAGASGSLPPTPMGAALAPRPLPAGGGYGLLPYARRLSCGPRPDPDRAAPARPPPHPGPWPRAALVPSRGPVAPRDSHAPLGPPLPGRAACRRTEHLLNSPVSQGR